MILMIKELCNLIGQKEILVNQFKVYVTYDKKTLFSRRVQIIFHSELFMMRQKTPPDQPSSPLVNLWV